ncbi:MAG: DUF2283 domain-containing protein [Bacteroidota bacterium]
MQIHYDSKTDLLYLRLESSEQKVTNKRVTDDIVLNLGANDKTIGIEKLMPITYSEAI